MQIRPYKTSDFKAVIELHKIALQASGVWIPVGSWDDDLQDISNNYQIARGAFMVGQFGSRLVAMGALRPLGPTVVELKRLRVHPDFQGRGCGRAMLDYLEYIARIELYRYIRLDTTSKQKAAQKLFERSGYIQTHQRTLNLSSGEKVEMLFYRKELLYAQTD